MKLQEVFKLKQYILTEFNQVEIFAHYLQADESDIEFCLEHTSNKINNPLRSDDNPSLGMKVVTDNDTDLPKIKMYDFGNVRYRGDCFDLVGIVLCLYDTRGINFITICTDIISTMQSKSTKINVSKSTLIVRQKAFLDIQVEQRNWNLLDIEFWKANGLIYTEINKYIQPVDKAYLDGKLIYKHSTSDPCYHYVTGYYEGKILRKLYFPKRNKKDIRGGRFITNNSYFELEGLHELRKADILVITKSYKDKRLLKKIISHLKINHTVEVTNLTAETIIIKPTLISALFNSYQHIILNTDFDYAGVIASRIRKMYPVQCYFLTNGRFNTENFNGKDISDIVKFNSFDLAVNICQRAYDDFIINLNNSEYDTNY